MTDWGDWEKNIDVTVERNFLNGCLVRLSSLEETEALKGAKQCLKAAIGWLDRAMGEKIGG